MDSELVLDIKGSSLKLIYIFHVSLELDCLKQIEALRLLILRRSQCKEDAKLMTLNIFAIILGVFH